MFHSFHLFFLYVVVSPSPFYYNIILMLFPLIIFLSLVFHVLFQISTVCYFLLDAHLFTSRFPVPYTLPSMASIRWLSIGQPITVYLHMAVGLFFNSILFHSFNLFCIDTLKLIIISVPWVLAVLLHKSAQFLPKLHFCTPDIYKCPT
ncbi:hypothetical protein XELAEV_18016828mg [Xenopus laevis]|uniref:Uncharacterized protein n=1 Tax=Xenopus laevis TaxID=8355 RepID=A0A974HRU5_XENLA|nr:hypothetical protein XELAEV_18016828mg [Xenopus laevis]